MKKLVQDIDKNFTNELKKKQHNHGKGHASNGVFFGLTFLFLFKYNFRLGLTSDNDYAVRFCLLNIGTPKAEFDKSK